LPGPMVRQVHTHVTVEGMPRAGFGFVGPTCKSRAGLRPSPPDQAGLPGQDLQSESTWRPVPAEVVRNNVFGSPDRGNRRRSQTALPSDRLGYRDGYPVREVTVGGYQVIVTRLSQDESADKYVRFHCSHRGHPLHSTDHSLWRCQRTRSATALSWARRARSRVCGFDANPMPELRATVGWSTRSQRGAPDRESRRRRALRRRRE
jgi:hypothetical protein